MRINADLAATLSYFIASRALSPWGLGKCRRRRERGLSPAWPCKFTTVVVLRLDLLASWPWSGTGGITHRRSLAPLLRPASRTVLITTNPLVWSLSLGSLANSGGVESRGGGNYSSLGRELHTGVHPASVAVTRHGCEARHVNRLPAVRLRVQGGRVVVRGQVIMGFGLGGVERWASATSSAVGLSRWRSPVGLRLGAIFRSSDRLWAA